MVRRGLATALCLQFGLQFGMILVGVSTAHAVELEHVLANPNFFQGILNGTPETSCRSSAGWTNLPSNFAGRSPPLACTDPVKAVCSKALVSFSSASKLNEAKVRHDTELNPPFDAAGLSAKYVEYVTSLTEDRAAGKISNRTVALEKEVTGFLKGYQNHLVAVQARIEREFATSGAAEVGLSMFYEGVRGAFVKRIRTGGEFRFPVAGVTVDEIAEKVLKIQLVTPATLAANGADFNSLLNFYLQCGSDGLVQQAFYTEDSNSLTLCPGLLLQAVSRGSMQSLAFVIGHEIGHSVDTLAGDFPGHPFQAGLLKEGYSPFLECIRKNYAARFNSITDAIRLLVGKEIPRLAARLAKVESGTPPGVDDAIKLHRAINSADFRLKSLKYDLAQFTARYGAAGAPVFGHAAELCADYQGTAALHRSLQLADPAAREILVQEELRIFCEKSPNELGDGRHPSGEFRIQNALRHPGVREALGCPKLGAADSPWCSMGGTAP